MLRPQTRHSVTRRAMRRRLQWPRGPGPEALVPVLLCAFVAVAWLPRTQGPLDLRWDAGVYYVLGTSLAEGKGYRLLNEPGEIRAIQYPPGLPALVAAHQLVLGTDDFRIVGRWLRLTFFVIVVGYALAAFALLRQFVPLPLATLGALLSIPTPSFSDVLMAEEPSMLIVTLFAFFALRADPVSRWLAGLCAITAYLFRTAGISVLLAWIADSAIRRKWRSLVLRLLVAAVPVLGWHAFIARVESDADYARPAYEYQRAAYLFNNVSYATNLRLQDPFRPELGTASAPELLWRSVRNLPRLPSALGEVVSGNRLWELELALRRLRRLAGPDARALGAQVVLTGLGIVTLLGGTVLLKRQEYLLSLLLITTMATVCATPWMRHWSRYLSPLTPIIVLAAIYGGIAAHQRLSRMLPTRHEGRAVVALAAAVVLVVNLALLAQTRQANHQRVEYEGRDGERIAYRLYFA